MEQEIAAGHSPEDARRIALRAMEGLTQRREECRDMRGVNYIEHLEQDLAYAWRMFRRAPAFAAVAVMTLALGIGVNVAIFSAVDSALLRALPYDEPDRVVMVWEDGSALGFGKNWPASGNFAEWRRRNHVFTGMDEIVDLDVADRRQETLLLVTFAGLAVLLASLGLYGILSYAVTERRRELGLRMALGATPVKLQWMVVSRGLLLTATGLAIGLAVSLSITHLMKNLLYGVGANDPATFAGVALLLTGVAAIACWIPARRASCLDPMSVLKDE